MQIDIPKLALGTWLMGGTKEPDPNNDDARDIAVIKLAIDSGVTLIDTAQNYANGRCEELVGQATASYPRESVQLLTKQSRLHLSYDEVIQGCHDSLKRLGVACLDYFVCHAPNPDFDLHDFFKASNQLHRDGLIRNVGVSNFGIRSLRVGLEASELPIVLNQVSFSINDSDILTSGTYDFCVRNNIPIQAYRPLVDIAKEPDSYDALVNLAQKMQLTPHQALVAYLHSYDGVAFTVRASSIDHWNQIQEALDIRLDIADRDALAKIHLSKKGGLGYFLAM